MQKKKILSWVILAGFIVLGIIFLQNNFQNFKNILNVKWEYVVIIFFTVFIRSIFNGLKLKILVGIYDIKLKIKEWFGLEIVSVVGNYTTPFRAGGISIKAAYLKNQYRFPYTSSLGITGLTTLIDVMTLGILGFFLSSFLPLENELKYGLSIFFVFVSLASIFALFFLPVPIKWNIRLLKHVAKSISQLDKLRQKKITILKLIPICLGRLLITVIAFYFAFRAFGFTVPFDIIIMMRILISLSGLVSLTPRNFGIQEAIIIIFSKLGGETTMAGAFAAILYRSVSIIFIFGLCPIFSFILSKKIIFNTSTNEQT